MKKRILVFRFSALGDVAMVVPVLYALTKAYPGYEVCLVSRPFAQNLVEPIEGVTFFPVDFNGAHKGFSGLLKLFGQLRKMGPWHLVADLHGVLRTHVLSFLFRLMGNRVVTINKGRQEKKALTRKKKKVFAPLKHTTQRYRDVFVAGGLPFDWQPFPGKALYASAKPGAGFDLFGNSSIKIGVAPFAKHHWKMWPVEKMRRLLKVLDERGMHVLFFGGRGIEQQQLEAWAKELKNGHSLAGQLTMAEELKAMSHLNLMISMDSANMHLASLTGTPVVSIWGATHPYAGFYGWEQPRENAAQIELPCRPCSVFGNKPCHRGDFACMEWLKVEEVLEKVERVLATMLTRAPGKPLKK